MSSDDHSDEKKVGKMSGYSGHVAGAGNYFGESSNRIALKASTPRNYREPNPHHFRGTSPRTNVPGYTGHLNGERDKYAGTFGNTVNQLQESPPTQDIHFQKDTPGYSGFVRSIQDFVGTTYGSAARQSAATVPSFSTPLQKKLHRDTPGYTGHVTGARDVYGTSQAKVAHL